MDAVPTIQSKTTRRTKRRLWWFAGIVLTIGIFAYATREFWFITLRSYLIGRTYVAAEEFGRNLPGVDEVEILVLGGEVAAGTPDSVPGDMGGTVGVVGHRTMHDKEAEQIASLWRNIPFDQHFASLCFSPYYALRFRHQGRLVLETSVCWHCSTYTLPVSVFGHTQYGFDSKSEAAQRLLAMLTQFAPHPATGK